MATNCSTIRNVLSVIIGPTTGSFPSLPTSRQYQIQVHTFYPGSLPLSNYVG